MIPENWGIAKGHRSVDFTPQDCAPGEVPYDELSDIGEYSGMEGDISGGVSENDTEEEEMTKTRDDDI